MFTRKHEPELLAEYFDELLKLKRTIEEAKRKLEPMGHWNKKDEDRLKKVELDIEKTRQRMRVH